MPPKRKAPLAVADPNLPSAPAAKKLAKGKSTTQGSTSSAATAIAPAKKYKYTEPSAFANLEPAKISFIKWPKSEDDEGSDDDDDDDEENIEPGSLQDILNGLANEMEKAVHEAINPPRTEPVFVLGAEIAQTIKETEKPFLEKMDKARQKFVSEGKMTEEEAKAIIGQDDKKRKKIRKTKRNIQQAVNNIQRERNKAVRLALTGDGKKVVKAAREKKRITAEASKPFEEKLAKLKETVVKYHMLTEEEAKAIVPNIGDEEEVDPEEEKRKEKEKQKQKELEEAVHPRVVTEEGFPVTKSGMEKFIKINQEMAKRDPDMHDMYIFNDYAGYGAIEVLENIIIEFNKIIFKKDVSPLEKWAIVEGLALYLAMGSHMSLMMNENSESVGEIFDMFGVLFFTSLEMLDEAGLIGSTSPLPDNIALMTLFFLDFMTNDAQDFDITWTHWIVWAADKYKVGLTTSERVKGVKQQLLDDARLIYQVDKRKGFAWKTEYPKFKREHPGGDDYDITKMPESEMAKYKFNNSDSDDD